MNIFDNLLLLTFSSGQLIQLCIALLLVQTVALMRFRRKLKRHNQELMEAKKELDVLLKCGRGIAERIKNQQNQMRGILNRQEKLEDHDPSQINYKQAIALMRSGVKTEELLGACEISRGELELISHLHQKRAAMPKNKAA